MLIDFNYKNIFAFVDTHYPIKDFILRALKGRPSTTTCRWSPTRPPSNEALAWRRGNPACPPLHGAFVRQTGRVPPRVTFVRQRGAG
jgi:hypothetical protein